MAARAEPVPQRQRPQSQKEKKVGAKTCVRHNVDLHGRPGVRLDVQTAERLGIRTFSYVVDFFLKAQLTAHLSTYVAKYLCQSSNQPEANDIKNVRNFSSHLHPTLRPTTVGRARKKYFEEKSFGVKPRKLFPSPSVR